MNLTRNRFKKLVKEEVKNFLNEDSTSWFEFVDGVADRIRESPYIHSVEVGLTGKGPGTQGGPDITATLPNERETFTVNFRRGRNKVKVKLRGPMWKTQPKYFGTEFKVNRNVSLVGNKIIDEIERFMEEDGRMRLKEALKLLEVGNKEWREEAKEIYRDIKEKLERGEIDSHNFPKKLDTYISGYYDRSKDYTVSVSPRSRVSVVFKTLSDPTESGGSVEGLGNAKPTSKDPRRAFYNYKITLFLIDPEVARGFYSDEFDARLQEDNMTQYLANVLKGKPGWPDSKDVYKTFIHEYIELRLRVSRGKKGKSKSSDYTEYINDRIELESRLDDAIADLEYRLENNDDFSSKFKKELNTFEKFEEWFREEFEDTFYFDDLTSENEEWVINNIQKWYESVN